MQRDAPKVAQAFAILFPRADERTARVLHDDGSDFAAQPQGTIIVGDPNSARDSSGWSGNLVDLSWDIPEREIRVRTSLAGFPPVYEVRLPSWWGVTTSLPLLRFIEGLELTVDADSVIDLCRLGFPVSGRTLFTGVSLLPAGQSVVLRPGGVRNEVARWEPDAALRFQSFADYAEHQVGVFSEVMARLDSARSLLSLSGGLDTRAIFAGLARKDAIPDCFTVSGPRTSLDALLAHELCGSYGVRHDVVVLAEDFYSSLWSSAQKASILSGGVSSLWAAPQTYCYTQLSVPSPHTVVISGFLGNQVGRGSTEGISSRPVDLSILHRAIRDRARKSAEEVPWYRHGIRSDGHFDRRFLIQEENQFASIAGYSIGLAHATQRSPYSDAGLIAAAVSMPPPPESGRSWIDPRITEMAKRFVGVGDLSFQRPFINSVGGAVATHPINYGWTASGMTSYRGLWLGARAFAEDIMTAFARRSKVASLIQRLTRLDGFSTHLYADAWIPHVREPLLDTLLSEPVRHAGILDTKAAEEAVTSFVKEGRSKLETVIAVTDLSLLSTNFLK